MILIHCPFHSYDILAFFLIGNHELRITQSVGLLWEYCGLMESIYEVPIKTQTHTHTCICAHNIDLKQSKEWY